MQQLKAIAFDLFDTLITVDRRGLQDALGRLLGSLQADGFAVQHETFLPRYREASQRFVEAARQDGRETHNRLWIGAALQQSGYAVVAEDPRIARAVEAYFSAFLDYASPLPETHAMLATLQQRYRLGLLSNFTHGPAARAILDRLGLTPYLEITVISGDIGYRKPHRQTFQTLGEQFGLPGAQIAFVGDDLENDIAGARQAGLQPIWTTYARAHKALQTTESSLWSAATPTPEVPTVASWRELLTLLGAAPG
jgi:putative hydrolase of the HAD superfamily